MLEKLKEWLDKINEYWAKLETRQKVKIGIGAGFILLVLISLFTWALTPEYTSIVTNVSDQEAGEIVAELETLGVPYRLEGNSILVPQARAIKTRYDLAASGFPKTGSIDYGIFTDTGFGMTKDQFSILKKGALEGELEKTINRIVVVEDSRVHLNIPEPSVWVRDAQLDASAAVYLNLRPGVSLDDNQILGIQQLVKMSVPGLNPESIILVDQNGRRLLAENSGADTLQGMFINQLDIKSQIESQIKHNLRNSLESFMGVGNVVVDAVAKMNFDQQSMREDLVAPVVGDDGIIISSQAESESSTMGTGGGAPGFTGNDPATFEAADEQTGTYERSFLIENREVNRTQIETIAQPYRVEDVSISILLNQDEEEPLPQELIDQINTIARNMVLTTATQNLAAEDVKIAVLAYKFDTTIADQLASRGLSINEIIYIALGVLVLVVMAVGAFVYWRSKRKPDVSEEDLADAGVEEENYDMELNEDGQQVRKQLEKFARTKPEDFTKLLRTWLTDD